VNYKKHFPKLNQKCGLSQQNDGKRHNSVKLSLIPHPKLRQPPLFFIWIIIFF
jgi:hypothetical protein